MTVSMNNKSRRLGGSNGSGNSFGLLRLVRLVVLVSVAGLVFLVLSPPTTTATTTTAASAEPEEEEHKVFFFSDEGQQLLDLITGNELPPYDPVAVQDQYWHIQRGNKKKKKGKRTVEFQLIDSDTDEDEYHVQWLSPQPPPASDSFMIKYMRGQSLRLGQLQDDVMEKAKALSNDEERAVVLDYYHALTHALDLATWDAILLENVAHRQQQQEECMEGEDDEEQTCRSSIDYYDPLDSLSNNEFNYDICDFGYVRDSHPHTSTETTESQYQDMVFDYSHEKRDLCLTMSGHLHSCASWRPHYHEVLVHYPARYIKNDIRRVAFLGGGDNFIVEEILKYSSTLELVVGLELDQGVVRNSFLKFGAQAYFDDDRVEWYFGDAAQSILMLPTDYYQSFDLVLVDLANDIVDVLMVTDDLSITDAAMLLLKPDGGIIARNEDWEFATSYDVQPFTKYMVDLFYVDVPIICYHGVTLGSNTVDFITTMPKDHAGVDTLFMKPVGVEEMEEDDNRRFELWYNYRESRSNYTINKNKLCKNQGSNEDGRELLADSLRSRLGMLMIIEAENVEVPLELQDSVRDAVAQALQKAGLTQTRVLSLRKYESRFEIVFGLKEGYLVARVWPTVKYCGFDLYLWESTDKQDAAKTHLVTAVGSKSVSSYRIMTGGMSGVDTSFSGKGRVGPRIRATCDDDTEPGKDEILDSSMNQSQFHAVVAESSSLLQHGPSTVLILCGEKSTPCNSLDVMTAKREPSVNAIPIWACSSLTDGAPEAMLDCENETAKALRALDDKIDGIVIDPEAPRTMGQILHKILSDVHFRRRLLSENHVGFAFSLNASTSTWHRALLDRFRTDFAIFDPAYRAEVVLSQMAELNIFSSGDTNFFSNLSNVVSSIEDKTGLSIDIRRVQNGLNNYVPDFKPSKSFTLDDYDDKPGLKQWYSQQPLSEQTLFQYTSKDKLDELTIQTWFDDALSQLVGNNNDDDTVKNDEAMNFVYEESNGCVIVSNWRDGSAVLIWDGREYMSVNFVTTNLSQDFEQHEQFKKLFGGGKKNKVLTLTTRDEMPRGIGRVMNFPSDLLTRDGDDDQLPRWAHASK